MHYMSDKVFKKFNMHKTYIENILVSFTKNTVEWLVSSLNIQALVILTRNMSHAKFR